ncbi:MAG: beta-N-acetylhexosaminidase [Planctomycetes bacterium]|nr:beta-N-acetylhexosaminidase [Planctomycetota bacterium]
MALSLLPQPKSVKTLVGSFDFKEVDTIIVARKASPRTKRAAQVLAEELKELFHLDYTVKPSGSVKHPHGCLITHHAREGIFVETTLKHPQAYELLAAGHALSISATDDHGFCAATRTLKQLLQEGTRIPGMKIEDWPLVRFRALHLDLKGLTPNPQALAEFVERAALYKYNTLLVEYADRFPYECLPELRGPHAFTLESHAQFLALADRHGLDVVPMVPTLGQMEFVLRLSKYRELAEVQDVPTQICPADPKAQKLVREMVREIVKAHPEAPFIHLGGGAAPQLGQHELTRAAAQKPNGVHDLFLKHIAKTIRQVKTAGKQVLLWDDLCQEMPPELLRKLGKDTGLIVRNYKGAGGQYRADLVPHLDAYRRAGLPVYGAFAVKGAEAYNSSVPNYRARMDNVDWWVEAAETQPGLLHGVVAMARSRYNANLTPCDPMPVIWPSALYAAERIWSGLGSSRESFERRMLAAFYGLRPEMTEVAASHYMLTNGSAKQAAETFEHARRSARRNRDVLELLELLAEFELLEQARKNYTEHVAGLLPQLEAGRADPVEVRKIKDEAPNMTKEIERLRRDLTRALLKRFHRDEVDEFVTDRLLINERLVGYVQNLLRRC